MGALYKCNECGRIEEQSVVGEGFQWQAPGGRWIFTLRAAVIDAASMRGWEICTDCAIKALGALANRRECGILQAELALMDAPRVQQAAMLGSVKRELAQIERELPDMAKRLEFERQRAKEHREKHDADVKRLRESLVVLYDEASKLAEKERTARAEERRLVAALEALQASIKDKRNTIRVATKGLPTNG